MEGRNSFIAGTGRQQRLACETVRVCWGLLKVLAACEAGARVKVTFACEVMLAQTCEIHMNNT